MRMGIRPGVGTIGGVMKDLPDDWFRPGSHEQPDEDEQHASSEQGERNRSVSYTHLTLPTIYSM